MKDENTKQRLNGDDITSLQSFQFIEKHLIDLVAETSIWVNPSNISLQPIYPDVRRGMPQDRGRIIEGVRIDDNTYANHAIKKAISNTTKFKNYLVCHIWPGTTYDARYHTLLPNLVLIPRILANLSDHCFSVINVLKYRSWELYGWHPQGESIPERPIYYPKFWRSFIENESLNIYEKDATSLEQNVEKEEYGQNKENIEIDKVKRKIPKWINHPTQINSRILGLYMLLSENGSRSIHFDRLREEYLNKFNNDKFDSNYNQMKNIAEKNHAKVFSEDEDGNISLWDPVADFIKNEYNQLNLTSRKKIEFE